MKCSKNKCKNEAAEGVKFCEYHREIQTKSRLKRRERLDALNLCHYCGKEPQTHGKMGDNCFQRSQEGQQKKIRHHREAGICIKCGKRPAQNTCHCKICTLKAIARKNLQDVSRAKEIGLLLHQQKHRCAYSGLRLVLGVNASLDHIVPRHHGGTNDLSNLQWVDSRINKWKGTTSDEEFRAFLLEVAKAITALCPD